MGQACPAPCRHFHEKNRTGEGYEIPLQVVYKIAVLRRVCRRDIEGRQAARRRVDLRRALATDPDGTDASPVAPEICVEVLSKSNSPAEIDEKRRLYFEHGALEVWTCDVNGDMRFYTPDGEQSHSDLVSNFPKHVDL